MPKRDLPGYYRVFHEDPDYKRHLQVKPEGSCSVPVTNTARWLAPKTEATTDQSKEPKK